MSLTTARAARFALALALFAPAGCQLFGHPGPTQVARGLYFSTGNPDYDGFFIELHRLQVELKDAPDRVAEPRRELAKALDVGIDADVIKEALAKRASELAGKQVKLSVQRPAKPDAPASLKVSGSPSGDDAEFVKTVEDALAKIGELKTAVDDWQKSLDALPKQDDELTGRIDTAFAGDGPGTRSDVKHNLSDGGKIIALLVTRTSDAARSNSELFDAVVAALGETAGTSAASSEKASEAPSERASETREKKHKAPPPAPRPAKAPRSAPPPAAPKPAARAPAAKPEPKPAETKAPKPAAGERSEVPPAPKPTQGTAKPDFEP